MNARNVTCLVAVQLIACAAGLLQAQRPTLPELASSFGPEPVYQQRLVELLPDTLEELVSNSDLIVRGTVESATTYLSNDQADLYTDYVLAPKGLMFRKASHSANGQGI